MGIGSFVDINILVMKYLFLHILHFFRISQIKIYKMLRPKKRILKDFVERYSFKFLALSAQHAVYTIHPKPGATQQSEENIQGRLTFSETSEYPFSSGLHFYQRPHPLPKQQKRQLKGRQISLQSQVNIVNVHDLDNSKVIENIE